MNSRSGAILALGFIALANTIVLAQARGPRGGDEQAVRYGWLSTLEEGKAQARRSGKPLLVVLRCVPCGSCRKFDGQVVRLEQLQDVADKFVRVRLTRIEQADLNLFEFDYDLTFMAFFLNADEKVYARYGGRDVEDPDARQSLAGLRYTMQSVLRLHNQADKVFAPRLKDAPSRVPDLAAARRPGDCLHCHQVREALNAELQKKGKWSRDLYWRYPLPENLGFDLEIDRGNVIKEVTEKTPAFAAGLRVGDVVRWLNGVPVHSFADAQLALDRAPKAGAIEIAWERGDQALHARLSLPEGWRQTDGTWRPTLRPLVPDARLYGALLTPKEKAALGLPDKQLAFRQKDAVSPQAEAAGIHGGDVIVGLDDKALEMDVEAFLLYVQRAYLVGDRVTVNVLREGKPLKLHMTFQP